LPEHVQNTVTEAKKSQWKITRCDILNQGGTERVVR